MMLEPAVSARLLGDGDFSAAIEGRVDWMRRPGRALPAVTLQIVSDPRPQHLAGFQRVRQSRVQVDVWASTAQAAAVLRTQTISLLAPAAAVGPVQFQRAQIVNVRPGFEQLEVGDGSSPRGELYRESIDFIFTHNAS